MSMKEMFEVKERIIEKSKVVASDDFLAKCFADIARYTVNGELVRQRIAAPLESGLLGYNLEPSELDREAPAMFAVFDSGLLEPEDVKFLTEIRLAQTKTQNKTRIAELREQAFDLIKKKYVYGFVIQPFTYDDDNGARQSGEESMVLTPEVLQDLITPIYVNNNRKSVEQSRLRKRITQTRQKMQPVLRVAKAAGAALGVLGLVWISGAGHAFADSSSGIQNDNAPHRYGDIDKGDLNASIALEVGPTPASSVPLAQLGYCNIRGVPTSILKGQTIDGIKCIAAAFGAPTDDGYWIGKNDTVAFTVDTKTNVYTGWTDRSVKGEDPYPHNITLGQPVSWQDEKNQGFTHIYSLAPDGNGGFIVVLKSIPASIAQHEATPRHPSTPDHKPGAFIQGPTQTPKAELNSSTVKGPKATVTPSPTPKSAEVVAPTTENPWPFGAQDGWDFVARSLAGLIGVIVIGFGGGIGLNQFMKGLDMERVERKRKKPMTSVERERAAQEFQKRLAEIAEHNKRFNDVKLIEEARALEQKYRLDTQLTNTLNTWLAAHNSTHRSLEGRLVSVEEFQREQVRFARKADDHEEGF